MKEDKKGIWLRSFYMLPDESTPEEQAESAAKLEEIKAALLEYYAKLEVAELLVSGKLEQQLAAYFAFWPVVEQAVAEDTS